MAGLVESQTTYQFLKPVTVPTYLTEIPLNPGPNSACRESLAGRFSNPT